MNFRLQKPILCIIFQMRGGKMQLLCFESVIVCSEGFDWPHWELCCRCCIFTRWKGRTRGEESQIGERGMGGNHHKNKGTYGVAGLQIGWLGSLTHVALVLGYNLAFWLAWNGQCSLWNWISVLYQQSLKICSYKTTCLWHWKCMHSKIRNFHTVGTVYYSYIELWFPLISLQIVVLDPFPSRKKGLFFFRVAV